MHTRMWIVIFLYCVFEFCHCSKPLSIDEAFKKGVEAYSGERWSECIAQFEDAIQLHKLYKSVIINCRIDCHQEKYESAVKDNFEDLKMYEKFFQIRNCLNECHNKMFNRLKLNIDTDLDILHKIDRRAPYEYLHVCYYQMNGLPKAASMAYTYFVAHPDDEQMKNNLQYYIEQPEVDKMEIVDLESEDYKILYNLGIKTYNEAKWGETIAAMEEVILDYLAWENRCRMECETQPGQEWSPEFVITISNNIASLIHCKQQCQDNLKILSYQSAQEFLADILNYLQISYYHLGKMNDTAKAVSTYLALNPNDEEMLENKQIYSTLVREEAFVERQDIISYLKRDIFEKEILNIFQQGDNSIPYTENI